MKEIILFIESQKELCKREGEEAVGGKSKGGCLGLLTLVSILDSGRPAQARNLPEHPSFQQGIFNRANIACQNVMYSGT